MVKILLLGFLVILQIAANDDVLKIVISPTVPQQKPMGSQIAFLCSVIGLNETERPGMLWQKTGGFQKQVGLHNELVKQTNIEVKQLDPYTLSLVIDNSTIMDSGIYTCTVQIGEKRITASVDVVVFGNIQFKEYFNDIENVMPDVKVNVSCELTVDSRHIDIEWYLNDKKIDSKDSKYKFYNSMQILEILSFDPVRTAGNFKCKATARGDDISRTRIVRVSGEPSARANFCNKMCTSVCENLYH